MSQSALVPSQIDERLTHPYWHGLSSTVDLWTNSSTNTNTPRRADLIRDKTAALLSDGKNGVAGFFYFVDKHPADVSEGDVTAWNTFLEAQKLSAATIYAKVSRVSAFYSWLLDPYSPAYGLVARNPVVMSRPKAPKAYQNESTQALSREAVQALMSIVKADASEQGNIAAKRDYVMLRFFFATGKRRAEIVQLTWGDLKVNGAILMRAAEKGSKYRSTEIRDPGVKAALFHYLKASGRWNDETDQPQLDNNEPLWLRHDRAANGKQAVTSHGFVKAFKAYAVRAGLGDVHLHQTRHTVADVVGNELGDVAAAQTILGHENQQTTREYLKTVAVKKDRFSGVIADYYGFDEPL